VFLGSDRLSIKRHCINDSGYRGGAGSRTSHGLSGFYNVANHNRVMFDHRRNRSQHGAGAYVNLVTGRAWAYVVGYNRGE
jgi:hypothetical protein